MKTTGNHFTYTNVTKKDYNIVRIQEIGMLPYHWWECEIAQPLWKQFLVPQKADTIELAYYPEILFLGIFPTTLKTCPHNLYMDVSSSIIRDSQNVKTIQCVHKLMSE